MQRQVISRNRYGILVVDEDLDAPQKLGSSAKTFAVPSFPDGDVDHLQSDVEEPFESHLARLEDSKTAHDYLNAVSHLPNLRKNLGLPK